MDDKRRDKRAGTRAGGGGGGAKPSARKLELKTLREQQGERARQARDHAGITQSEMGRLVAQEFNLKSPQMYFRKENGERGLSAAERRFIAQRTGVRLEWLTYDDGPMVAPHVRDEPDDKADANARVRAAPNVVDDALPRDHEQALFDLWNSTLCNPIEPRDLEWLRHHLYVLHDKGDLESLELSLKGRRDYEKRTEETKRAYHEAGERWARERDKSHVDSSRPPPPSADDGLADGAISEAQLLLNRAALKPPRLPLPPKHPRHPRRSRG